MKAAVIGHPIKHSKSPLIHNYWLQQHHIDGLYQLIDIEPKNLQDGIQKIIDDNYDGFNVTIPYKQAIMDLCDDLDPVARTIGAVNTVRIKNGKLHGRNTDAFGFIENVKTAQPDFNFQGKTALVLGAGGAARAVVYGLIDQGVETIVLSNRTIENANKIRELEPEIIRTVPWEQRDEALKTTDLLVNTTALGMEGQPPLEINLTLLPTSALVCDIVYAPLMTPLLKHAVELGNPIVTGIGMLLHQARPAFQAWTGILPDVSDELVQKVLA